MIGTVGAGRSFFITLAMISRDILGWRIQAAPVATWKTGQRIYSPPHHENTMDNIKIYWRGGFGSKDLYQCMKSRSGKKDAKKRRSDNTHFYASSLTIRTAQPRLAMRTTRSDGFLTREIHLAYKRTLTGGRIRSFYAILGCRRQPNGADPLLRTCRI